MKLQTQIPLQKAKNQIDYSSQILLLGSCFSENIGAKFTYFKFRNTQNPFGILFHPLAIERMISRAVQNELYTQEDLFYHNERWHCFDAHSDLSDISKEKVLENLNTALLETRDKLLSITHVIITLGTAWVYEYIETGSVVANCHKLPQSKFEKRILSSAEIFASLESTIEHIKSINKNIKFVFTVSPVRHLKDGFVENQRSKSHLTTALHTLLSVPPLGARGLYFPSYEIMMDELRDYRFYGADMVHPNELAIDYIWEKFQEVWIADEAKEVIKKIDDIQRGLNHIPFNSESEQHQKFKKSLNHKIEKLQQEFSFMKFK